MSATIPAGTIVGVTPGVLGAGGSGLALSGLFLTTSSRVPIGTVPSFPLQSSVAAYFGPASNEAKQATVYFNGFTNSNIKPGALLFSQYPIASVGAYLRGGSLAAMTLAQLQALSGVLIVSINGTPITSSSINLSSATSFSQAAQIITLALGQTGPTTGSVTGSIGATATGTGTGTSLAVSPVVGVIHIGDTITGTGVPGGTTIIAQVSGSTGGAGTYTTSASTTASSASLTFTSTVLDVTAIASGSVGTGQQVTGSGITADTFVSAQLTGTTGGIGTYTISVAQQVGSEALTIVTPTCTFDSIASAFTIISSTVGTGSTIGFGSGTIAVSLALTQATGAVTSEGAIAAVPGTAMAAITAVTQDWVSFTTLFDPDAGSGNAQKQLFSAWVNGTNDGYTYVAWDTDITPTQSTAATSSLGYILKQSGSSGTQCIYEPSDLSHAAFICGAIASIDPTEHAGRTTMAFREQSGLVSAGLNATQAANLQANGYNYYTGYATRANGFTFYYPGSISGEFLWADSYIDQIILNDACQVALLDMMIALKSFPYTAAGYANIDAALADPIQAGLNFGSIVPGVTLSAAQISEINTAAGNNAVAGIVSTRGWYLQILDADPSTRAARGSPPCTLWYADGGSVQKIALASVEVQ